MTLPSAFLKPCQNHAVRAVGRAKKDIPDPYRKSDEVFVQIYKLIEKKYRAVGAEIKLIFN